MVIKRGPLDGRQAVQTRFLGMDDFNTMINMFIELLIRKANA